MPSQGTEAERVRRRTSDNTTTFPDEDVDLLFDQAEEDYAGYSRKVFFQAVVVTRLSELVVSASKAVTYQLNETRENLSDIAKILKDLLEDEQKKLDELLDLEKGVALRTAVMKPVPTRRKTYPNG
jgi:hypothetical protein